MSYWLYFFAFTAQGQLLAFKHVSGQNPDQQSWFLLQQHTCLQQWMSIILKAI
jgi:hypothetical protein